MPFNCFAFIFSVEMRPSIPPTAYMQNMIMMQIQRNLPNAIGCYKKKKQKKKHTVP